MNVLIVSDDPERKSFRQILNLRREIRGLGRHKVDLLLFSNNGLFLNQDQIGKKANATVIFESVLRERTYGLIAISLKSSNLWKLFPEKRTILDAIEENSPQTDTFIFGASSVLERLDKERAANLFLYSRPGVGKLTRDFKKDLIGRIKTERSE